MRLTIILITFAVITILAIFIVTRSPESVNPTLHSPSPTSTAAPSSTPVKFSAEFKIITNGLVRNFSSSKYHNQSDDVYINASNPSKIVVESSGVTWSDFFNSLPMKLSKECLTTGDGETLCASESSSLKFYNNDAEVENLLDKEINPGDSILIEYKSN